MNEEYKQDIFLLHKKRLERNLKVLVSFIALFITFILLFMLNN